MKVCEDDGCPRPVLPSTPDGCELEGLCSGPFCELLELELVDELEEELELELLDDDAARATLLLER